MNGLCKYLLAALLLLISPVCLAEESPEKFLSQILEEDFLGDGGSRIHKGYYSDGKGEHVGDCGCIMSRAIYFLHEAPLLVVTKWEIVRVDAKRKKSAVIDVRFRVCGKTEGERWSAMAGDARKDSYRSIVPFSTSADEIVTYRLVKKKDGWRLVDPPPPGVAKEPIVLKLEEEISSREKFMAKNPDHSLRLETLQNLKEQLEALRKANCQGE
ncbi:MAG: hypothetical protein OEL53_16045 [Rhodospirillales bacterium]|nr:hypothetical protein [Rhodospirillales bacterium]